MALGNWRTVLYGMVFAGILAAATGLYVKGRADANAKNAIAQLTHDKAVLTKALQTAEAVALADKAQAASDALSISLYEDRVNELLSSLKDADRQCLDPADTDSLRKLWQ